MNLEGKEQNIGAGKLRTAEPKNAQEHKTTRVIEREERKEKRVLMKMEECWMISPLEVWNAPR